MLDFFLLVFLAVEEDFLLFLDELEETVLFFPDFLELETAPDLEPLRFLEEAILVDDFFCLPL